MNLFRVFSPHFVGWMAHDGCRWQWYEDGKPIPPDVAAMIDARRRAAGEAG